MHPTREPEHFDKDGLVELGVLPNEMRSPKSFEGTNEISEMLGSIMLHEKDSLGNQDEEDDDDIDQLSIDEVDQVRVDSLDNNLAVDEEFQHSLNERANQFSSTSEGDSINTNSFPSIPRPKVEYQYKDDFQLHQELSEWFTTNELTKLNVFRKIYESIFRHTDFCYLSDDKKLNIISSLKDQLLSPQQSVHALSCLVYISLGAYGNHRKYEEHVSNVQKNNGLLAKSHVIPILIKILQESFEKVKNVKNNVSYNSNVLFMSSTILYFIICTHIEDSNTVSLKIVTTQLDKEDFLCILAKCIDDWRWNSIVSLRIRNIIGLFAKAFCLLVGNFADRNKTKKLVYDKLGIKKETDPSKLTTTPLDYYVFREDLLARYPTSIPPPSTFPENFENTASLSQFINTPRTLETSKANSSLPVPSVHISTPAPSPPSTPVTKTNKVKRSYQTNQSYPFIYPSNSPTNDIPKSIEEASELCASRVQEKLSLMQLWDERENFMQQERGWTDAVHESKKFDDYSDLLGNQVVSLSRVEKFYAKSLPYLSSLTHVLLQVVVSAQENNQVLDTEIKDAINHKDLEMMISKEIALKNATYILILLLKWFKVGHILKFEHLSTLIYDSNYFTIMIQYLKLIGESIHQRITNETLCQFQNQFWTKCSAFSIVSYDIPGQNSIIDQTFCFNLTSILTIGSLICHKKTQRIISLSEKDPARLFKRFFLMINSSLWKPILKMIKEITPFNGRKWKSYNMDLISMVYLHMKPQLRENWLSGRDLDGELKDAYGQEIALRALIQFYNVRRYSIDMKKMGYEKREGDFFTREMELIAF